MDSLLQEGNGEEGWGQWQRPTLRELLLKENREMKRRLEGQMDLGGWVGVRFNMGGTVACLH